MQQLIDLRNETPEAISLQAIGAFMEVGRPAIVLFSGGKDSSVLLNLALTAAVEQARQGRNPMVVIARSDVGVENLEIQRLASGEIAKAARFVSEHGVTAVVRVADIYEPHDARLWLFARQRLLDDQVPAELIQEGRVDEVLASVSQLLDGVHL